MHLGKTVEIIGEPHSKIESRDEFGRFRNGFSGNPGGRKPMDEAQLIAKQVFEENGPEIVKALAAKLRKGDINAFVALAERGYGKMPQTSVVVGELDVNVGVRRDRITDMLAALKEPGQAQ